MNNVGIPLIYQKVISKDKYETYNGLDANLLSFYSNISTEGIFITGLVSLIEGINDTTDKKPGFPTKNHVGNTSGNYYSGLANILLGEGSHEGVYGSTLMNRILGSVSGVMITLGRNNADYVHDALLQCGTINKVTAADYEIPLKKLVLQFGASNKVEIVSDDLNIIQIGLRNTIGNKSRLFINYFGFKKEKKSLEDKVDDKDIKKVVENNNSSDSSDNLPFNIVSDEPKPNDYSHLNSPKDR